MNTPAVSDGYRWLMPQFADTGHAGLARFNRGLKARPYCEQPETRGCRAETPAPLQGARQQALRRHGRLDTGAR